ncbi:sigma-54 interaction domain-containing protein [Desulfoluna butyratoxydans]|uniref:Bacterial regulatory protein fis family n=1 Tax=Desulfoluna butyratoxydans TaxID=231438 RepID=A0A4U8YIQ9_9BACT|nr:sigma 54-interacting transcriptional regulator [Desulfoluna butyratoxydans]VFQ42859.1 bacterial regulatory protein fis family [Desulfoluna butyratoxydans]
MTDPDTLYKRIGLSLEDLTGILSETDDGVLITDANGMILFYNEALSRIDSTERSLALGRQLTEVYTVTEEDSPTLACLATGRTIIHHTQFYRTRHGRAVFAMQNVFPLFDGPRLKGAICFVREYSAIEREVDETSRFRLGNSGGKGREKRFTFGDIVGSSPGLQQCLHTARMAAGSPSPIMIYGESGTGKELFAQSVHNDAPWRDSPFVAVNCSAIPETLLEGILFGTSKGAFTDARDKAGLFEKANGGTLFLDEVNSMPLGLQAKLLRAIQEKKIRRVGSATEISIELKVISSVNEEPRKAIENATLRRDLYYRLAVVHIAIPPLRERMEDIPLLVDHFIAKCNTKLNRAIRSISDEVMGLFHAYAWPGNIRELEHVIEGAMNLVGDRHQIERTHMPSHFMASVTQPDAPPVEGTASQAPETLPLPPMKTGASLPELLNTYEKTILDRQLATHDGNAAKAARSLGISRQLMYHKMRKLGIRGDRHR